MFICFSPKYTTANALVSTAGMIAFVFIRDLLIPHSSAAALCSKASSPISALPAPIVLGAPFTLLVAAMSSKCNCSSSCCAPFEFGALLTSSPHVPCILGPGGELMRESETTIEENNFEVDAAIEMQEAHNPPNSSLSNDNIVDLVAKQDTAISGMDLPLSDVNAGTEHKAVLEDQAGEGKERNSV